MISELGRLELVRESLIAVVSEMRANVIRSSYSSIIYEGHDFSCALLLGDGRLVAQGEGDNPVHIFAVPYSTKEILNRFGGDINEGDIFLHNDPYTGGTHLNDVLMIYPVFYSGKLAMFAATRCHWGDVGGTSPGSLSGSVNEIYQEGMRILPTRICERGVMNRPFLDLLFANMRIVHERKGDFNTMVGTSRKAAEHLQRLFKRFGGQVLLDAVEELIARAEKVMRSRIAAIPDGVYFAEGYLDSNGHSAEPLIGRLKLTVDGEQIIADFSGSSKQTMGATNVGPAMALNAVATVVKSYLDPYTPVNHGSFNPIQIINPVGSFINATLPAPCGGMNECRYLLTGVVISALGQAMPEKLVGDLKGGANHLYIFGPKLARRDLFLLYEYPAGGTGATKGRDGNHGLRTFLEGDFNAVQSVETIEAQCPILVERYAIREGSFGDGEFRGGCGIVRDYRVLSDGANLSVLSDKNVIPPFGVAGGKSGAGNRFTVISDGQVVEPSAIPGKVGGYALKRGDIVHVETAGGGGFGDPLKRDLRRVQHDHKLGLISKTQARGRFGVVFDDVDGTVDERASMVERARLNAARVNLRVRATDTDEFDGNRRLIRLNARVAGLLGVQAGALVEISASSSGASLRGWAAPSNDSERVSLGPTGRNALCATSDSVVEIRAVQIYPT